MKKLFILFAILLILPLTSALTISDTTFFSTVTNFTIFVDQIVLDNVTITNKSIQFHGLTSTGSNFTNTNQTSDAIASFFDLAVNLTIRNVNTSVDLFTASATNGEFNATLTPGQVITILAGPTSTSTVTTNTCNEILGGFLSFFNFMPTFFIILAIIIIVIMFLALLAIVMHMQNPLNDSVFEKVKINIDLSDQGMIAAFIGLGILGFIGIIFVVMLGFLCTI